MKDHEYFILIWDDNFKKIFVMMCTLDGTDWKGEGKNTILKIGTWWEKYKDQKDKYVFLCGSIRNSNAGAQIEFEDFVA